jgi:hypothetical protein
VRPIWRAWTPGSKEESTCVVRFLDPLFLVTTKLVVVVDDLDFKDVTFEVKVFNRYGTFDQIANMSMEYPSYAYLYGDLLDRVVLTIITLRVKSLYI